jgi:hypothetical protein
VYPSSRCRLVDMAWHLQNGTPGCELINWVSSFIEVPRGFGELCAPLYDTLQYTIDDYVLNSKLTPQRRLMFPEHVS